MRHRGKETEEGERNFFLTSKEVDRRRLLLLWKEYKEEGEN
jgi:hypothetical protein